LCRFNDDVVLTVGRGGGDCLVLVRLQGAPLLRLLTHALDSGHYILLLVQKGVAQVGCPVDIRGQVMKHIGEHNQRLHAGVPRLFRCRIGQRFPAERRILFQPLISLDDFQRIRGCDQHLAEDWIRIESHWGNQAVQLIRGE
jgi:hypothetical protein